jgi:hypothetical protein
LNEQHSIALGTEVGSRWCAIIAYFQNLIEKKTLAALGRKTDLPRRK